MDPVLAEVYSTVMPLAPYVIGAYALIWVTLLVFVIVMLVRVRKTDADIKALHEAIDARRASDVTAAGASEDEEAK